MKLETGTKLLFIGDSITDCGRNQPNGEGLFNALGSGYVSLVDALLQSTYGSRRIRVVNQGLSGNTILDLERRWQSDVLDRKPNWLSVCIGINDVWRQFDTPLITESHVALDVYEKTYRSLLDQTRPKLDGLILMTPFFIEPNQGDAMRARMDEYSACVRRLAADYEAIFVDLQQAFDQACVGGHPMQYAWDRVHPNASGAMVIARALLNSVDYAWDGRA